MSSMLSTNGEGTDPVPKYNVDGTLPGERRNARQTASLLPASFIVLNELHRESNQGRVLVVLEDEIPNQVNLLLHDITKDMADIWKEYEGRQSGISEARMRVKYIAGTIPELEAADPTPKDPLAEIEKARAASQDSNGQLHKGGIITADLLKVPADETVVEALNSAAREDQLVAICAVTTEATLKLVEATGEPSALAELFGQFTTRVTIAPNGTVHAPELHPEVEESANVATETPPATEPISKVLPPEPKLRNWAQTHFLRRN